jgi:hypothetical protein
MSPSLSDGAEEEKLKGAALEEAAPLFPKTRKKAKKNRRKVP